MNKTQTPHIRAARTLLPFLAAALLGAALGAAITLCFCRRTQFSQLARLAYGTAQAGPEAEQAVLAALRPVFAGGPGRDGAGSAETFLQGYGYRPEELPSAPQSALLCAAGAALLAGGGLWAATVLDRRRRRQSAERLTEYLSRVDRGGQGALLPAERDEFGPLRDELYKTVTALQSTRRQAETARARYAQNLADIAHQMKTPIAAASACLQLLEDAPEGGASGACFRTGAAGPAAQARRQLARLDALGQALLTLSRIDAGVLPLASRPVDACTALSLAADALEELAAARGVAVATAGHGPAEFTGDLDWTVEALLNLVKNCVEHSPPGGRVLCDYEKTPLYLEFTIRDEGEGFAKEDLPHLFERFYRGGRAAGGGAGIGLALAKTIFEAQNGVVSAENCPGGGAQFTVRLYPR